MTTLIKMKLFGKVKSVHERSQILTKATCEPWSGSITYFDKSGMLIKSEKYSCSLSGVYQTEHQHYRNGKLMKTVSISDNFVTNISVYHYRTNGIVFIKESLSGEIGIQKPTGPVILNKYKCERYNKFGELVVSKLLEDGKILSRKLYSYKIPGKILRTIQYNGEEMLSVTETFSYDKNGNLLEKK